MRRIRVLVIEDSLTIRKRLVEVLAASPDFEVVGEAENGHQGVDLCQSLRPEVVTMDMMMPEVSGLTATEHIMAHCPTPIVIVSSSTNRGELFNTFQALAAGAVEVLDKPHGDEIDQRWEDRLISTLKVASRIKVITHPRARLDSPRAFRPARNVSPKRGSAYRLIAIGASTGGPQAILQILRSLAPDFPLPILLVIHIGQPFGSAFAEWLNGQSSIPVTEAADGMRLPQPGDTGLIIAPPDRHLMVAGGRLRLTEDPERHSCRPSVDVLFESVAREIGSGAIACLLTGMGKDGAFGALAIRWDHLGTGRGNFGGVWNAP